MYVDTEINRSVTYPIQLKCRQPMKYCSRSSRELERYCVKKVLRQTPMNRSLRLYRCSIRLSLCKATEMVQGTNRLGMRNVFLTVYVTICDPSRRDRSHIVPCGLINFHQTWLQSDENDMIPIGWNDSIAQ